MDTRIALAEGTELCFTNQDNGMVRYRIQSEVGRGGSCIVYDASYQNNIGQKRLVRIKECYPFKLSITRDDKNRLVFKESDREALYFLFESYVRFEIGQKERKWLDLIIDKSGGHTLVLEMIAKQIANSYMTIKEAAILAEQNGFSHIAGEKVQYQKDRKFYYEKISDIINAIFSFEHVTEEKRVILKVLSLFSLSGISVNRFSEILELSSKDTINELIRDGWINISGKQLSLHPVISEIIQNWEMVEAYEIAAIKIMQTLLKHVDLEKDKKDYTDFQKIREWLYLSESALRTCAREQVLRSSCTYKDLLYVTIMSIPRDREQYILEKAEELLNDDTFIDGIAKIKLYALIVSIYSEKMEFNNAYAAILEAEKIVRKFSGNDIKGRYYDMLATYYDARLGGAYYDDNEYSDIKNMMDAIEKSIFYMKKNKTADGKMLLAKYLLSKAQVSIRCFPKKKRGIHKILNSVNSILEESMQDNSELRYEYDMVRAWYYTLVEPDKDEMSEYMRKAYDIAKATIHTELNMIDDIMIPCANMYMEWQQYDSAAMCLNYAVRICENHPDILPYIRKKQELYLCLLDVYSEAGEYGKWKEIVSYFYV